jgi:hypothetical protein
MSTTLVTPYLISIPFGADAANPTYINLPIPVPSQISITVNAASFTDGFPPSTMTPETSGGLPFFGQDMNGILYMISAYCANFAAGALPVWSTDLATDINGYPLGAVLVNASGDGLWISQVDGNVTNPDAGGAGWVPLATTGGSGVAVSGGSVTLTPAQYAVPFIQFTGTLTSNCTVTFPTFEGAQWIVANATAGGFTLRVQTSAGTPITIPQTGNAAPTSIYCDGTYLQNTGVSTAGLAPINSPALTGTPTAPTASPATTNTTQIATTAFTQAAITAALALYARLASPIFSGVPTAPTASPGTNTLQLASTAFVTAAIAAATVDQVRGGSFTNTGGSNTSVAFSPAFTTACKGVSVTPNYASPDVGWIVPGSISRTGFVWFNGNGGANSYTAVGD